LILSAADFTGSNRLTKAAAPLALNSTPLALKAAPLARCAPAHARMYNPAPANLLNQRNDQATGNFIGRE